MVIVRVLNENFPSLTEEEAVDPLTDGGGHGELS